MAVVQAFSHARLSGPRPARRLGASRQARRAAPQPLQSANRGASLRVRADLDPDNASFLVAGGGGVALEVTRQLKDMGSWVWQLQRTDARRCVGRRRLLLSDTQPAGAACEPMPTHLVATGRRLRA